MPAQKYGGSLSGDGPIRIEGMRELRKSLKDLDPQLQKELRLRMKAIAEVVAADARGRAPVLTGRLQSSIRSWASGSAAGIVGGKKTIPYYGWIDFGGVNPPSSRPAPYGRRIRPFIERGRILYPAIDANIARIRAAAEDAFENAKREVDL